MYYVKSLGPSVQMGPRAEEWAEQTGQKPEKVEFGDLERARVFARRVRSRVEDAKGNVVYDPAAPEEAPDASG
jgi:hypothetical protein